MTPRGGKRVKFCSDYKVPVGCCNSCHEDNEEYGYDMVSAPDDEESHICCAVANYLAEHKPKARAIVKRKAMLKFVKAINNIKPKARGK